MIIIIDNADHIFIQIYFRMHHFVVKFSKFSSPQAARGHWPPKQNPSDPLSSDLWKFQTPDQRRHTAVLHQKSLFQFVGCIHIAVWLPKSCVQRRSHLDCSENSSRDEVEVVCDAEVRTATMRRCPDITRPPPPRKKSPPGEIFRQKVLTPARSAVERLSYRERKCAETYNK